MLARESSAFMRRDEVEAAWRWSDGVIEGWAQSNQPLETYAAGLGANRGIHDADRTGCAWN